MSALSLEIGFGRLVWGVIDCPGPGIEINDIVKLNRKDLGHSYNNSFKDIMETIHE